MELRIYTVYHERLAIKLEERVEIFLDESGKLNNQISLIGAISIPRNYYFTSEIQELNKKLQDKDIKLHFTKYNKADYELYKSVISKMLHLHNMIQVNIITFKRTSFNQHTLLKGMTNDMIYGKVPERVIYGLLRNYGNLEPIKADVFVESSTEYKKRQLAKNIKEQINTHALYRYDYFKVIDSKLVPKNKEIGIEFTDLLLGIIHFIMLDNPLFKNNDISKTALSKARFINDMLEDIEPLLKMVKIFELSTQDHLTKISFDGYLSFFKAKLELFKEKYPEEFENHFYKK